MGEKLT